MLKLTLSADKFVCYSSVNYSFSHISNLGQSKSSPQQTIPTDELKWNTSSKKSHIEKSHTYFSNNPLVMNQKGFKIFALFKFFYLPPGYYLPHM